MTSKEANRRYTSFYIETGFGTYGTYASYGRALNALKRRGEGTLIGYNDYYFKSEIIAECVHGVITYRR